MHALQPPFYPDHTKLLIYRDADGKEHPIRTAEEWAIRRQHILGNMQLVMGTLPDASRKVALDIQVLSEERLPAFTRQKVTFAVEKNDRVFAYLLIPHNLQGKSPAMLCLHQTTAIGKAEPAGVGGSPNLHYAAHLAERGYVTLAPDYPNYGDYKFDPYAHGYVSATMKGIWNHSRAVDLLQSLPEVDGERIGVIGHSLGGHNAMFVAAFDARLKVIVSSCGFNAFPKYYGGNLAGWSHSGYMPRIASVYGNDPKKMPFDFPEIVAALAPRPFFANAPVNDSNFEVSGVKDCLTAALPVYELLGARDRLRATHPACGHDFPADVRQAAYAWIDKWLKQ
ncbi:MAG: alpha/beta fold hydrolase [Abditibacteriales bacterium]|nr:alpha/beta fold hydrolase [Abditibacteriales bacterium]